ncbi:MAG: hypothetical protein FWH17_02120 [Oscillospiraceae bacterium]|nr:hypothetical protein [Oscillospiraceae bacterium]
MREDITTTNYAPFIKLPENVKEEKGVFTAEEIKKLEDSLVAAAKITLMLIYTGMRIGELLIDGYNGNKTVANFRKRDYYTFLHSCHKKLSRRTV